MPLTQIDPTPALIVIDLQKGIAAMPTAQPSDKIIDRTAQLARAFRERGFPVVLVNVTGTKPRRTDAGNPKFAFPDDWADLVPQLGQQPDDILIHKQTWGAFLGTTLDDELRKRGVTQLFFTGIATSIGVESTARSAFDLGYNIVLVTDAMTDRDPESHRFSVEKIFPRLGESDTTENVLARLQEAGQ